MKVNAEDNQKGIQYTLELLTCKGKQGKVLALDI